MRGPVLGWVGFLVLGTVTVGLGLQAFAEEPPAPPPLPYDAALTARERCANLAAYRKHVVSSRQYLLHEHLGEWIAIAGGDRGL